MAQMTFAVIPGFVDLPDSAIAADQPLTDYSITKISNNAKFAAVRQERFQGYYKHGETVLLPTSLVDGYQFSRQELRYEWSLHSPLNATGLTNGTANPPALDSESMQVSGGGLDTLEWFVTYVENKAQSNPGLVHVQIRVNNGTMTTIRNQGVLYVTTVAERLGG